jgi:hypothetical protein
MAYRDNEHDAGEAAGGELDFPAALGWRRMAELDEESRQAWELRDGTVLLLDPTGRSDSRICPRRAEAGSPAPFPAEEAA